MNDASYYATTPAMRRRVGALVKEAKDACHRALFEDISMWSSNGSGVEDRPSNKSNSVKRSKLIKSRNWEAILEVATEVLPFATENEHGILSRCAAIYLLGFLNPYSTGCEFASLRSTSSTDSDAFFVMELEERLENSSRFFQASDFGQVHVCADANFEQAFRSFVLKGLGPFLNGRAAHSNQTDLLHLLAMAVSSQLKVDAIDNVVAPFEDSQVPAWTHTKRLMRCLYAQSFALDYVGRLLLLKTVSTNLVLSPSDSPQILAGAVPHLLAAMHAFASHTARTAADAHAAHAALVHIATQSRQEWIVRDVFYILLAQMLEDHNRCKCPTFCSHKARGDLLRDCILRFNISRHHANKTFTEQVFMALAASIDEQLEPWKLECDNEPQGGCLLSSLLHAAEALFFIMDQDTYVDTISLLKTSIQLLHHTDGKVRNSASSLLSVAFAYMPIVDTNKLMVPVFESLKLALGNQFTRYHGSAECKSFLGVISMSARTSSGFASSLMSYLLEERFHNWKSDDPEFDATIAHGVTRCISYLACANPAIAFRYADSIRKLLQVESSVVAKEQLVASLLATRQAFPFGKDNKATDDIIEAYVMMSTVCWRDVLMARHALVTGNFSVAKSLYDRLLQSTSEERCFLWLLALSKIAGAESYLIENGATGIPEASILIQTAISHLESLCSQRDKALIFQITFLRLRLDFLDLSGATRMICREIRLSGTFPKDTSRGGLHLVNAVKSWGALAYRYRSLYRQYGLVISKQSRAAIRTIQSICQQIESASFCILSEAISNRNRSDAVAGPKGDQMHPTIQLLRKLNASILSKIDKSVEPSVRVTLLIELLEGIHRSTFPFPRSFTQPKNYPLATLQVSLDPSQRLLSLGQEELSIEGLPYIVDSTAVYPGTNISFVASGSIPVNLIQDCSPLLQLLLWTRIRLVSSLLDGGNVDVDEDGARTPDQCIRGQIQDSGPIEIQHLSTSNHFLVTFEFPQINFVGVYVVEFRLGCKLFGGDWQLPHDHSRCAILLRVTRRLNQSS